ncbi:24118_t:CDS:2, partial [Cetraspora pellucida]
RLEGYFSCLLSIEKLSPAVTHTVTATAEDMCLASFLHDGLEWGER